ncbi:hypothetical protein [Nocardia thraciensis]
MAQAALGYHTGYRAGYRDGVVAARHLAGEAATPPVVRPGDYGQGYLAGYVDGYRWSWTEPARSE